MRTRPVLGAGDGQMDTMSPTRSVFLLFTVCLVVVVEVTLGANSNSGTNSRTIRISAASNGGASTPAINVPAIGINSKHHATNQTTTTGGRPGGSRSR